MTEGRIFVDDRLLEEITGEGVNTSKCDIHEDSMVVPSVLWRVY